MPVDSTVKLHRSVVIMYPDLVNLYGCTICAETKIGPFVEIQQGAVIGARCTISSHSFICSYAVLEDDVFIGHGVMFTNDKFPKAGIDNGKQVCHICRGASIGSGAIIVGPVTIGPKALIGAGAVVTRNVEHSEVVAGVPARRMR